MLAVLGASLCLAELYHRVGTYGPAVLSLDAMGSVHALGDSGLLQAPWAPGLRYELVPGVDKRFKLTRFQTSSAGLRDREYALEEPPDVFRVAVIGDSFTMGSGVAIEDVYHSLLENRLNAESAATESEFLNFGVGGQGLRDYVAALAQESLAYDPDSILLGLTRNDQTPIGPHPRPFQSRPVLDPSRRFALLDTLRELAVRRRRRALAEAARVPVAVHLFVGFNTEGARSIRRFEEAARDCGFFLLDVSPGFEGRDACELHNFEDDHHPTRPATRSSPSASSPSCERATWFPPERGAPLQAPRTCATDPDGLRTPGTRAPRRTRLAWSRRGVPRERSHTMKPIARTAAVVAHAVLFGSLAPPVAARIQEPGAELYPVRVLRMEDAARAWAQGFMNRAGEVVLPARWARACRFREGLARVAEGGDWGFIDPAGEVVIPPRYRWATDFSEGLAQVLVAEQVGDEVLLRTGFIRPSGELAIAARFDFENRRESLFHGGLACVAVDGLWGYIDPQGAFVIPARFEAAGDFSEGLAAVQVEGLWGYVDPAGDMAIEPRFAFAGDFSEGLAWVNVGDAAGCIDADGELVIEPGFEPLLPYYASDSEFSEGLACVFAGGKAGFVDRAGELVIEPRFDFASPFSEGLARVGVARKTGFVDRTGEFVLEPVFLEAEDFRGGLAFVKVDARPDRFAYVDVEGRTVWSSE